RRLVQAGGTGRAAQTGPPHHRAALVALAAWRCGAEAGVGGPPVRRPVAASSVIGSSPVLAWEAGSCLPALAWEWEAGTGRMRRRRWDLGGWEDGGAGSLAPWRLAAWCFDLASGGWSWD